MMRLFDKDKLMRLMQRKYVVGIRLNDRTLDRNDIIAELYRGLDLMQVEGKTPHLIILSTRAWGELTGAYTQASFPDEMEMTFKGIKVRVQTLPEDEMAIIIHEPQKEIEGKL